MAIRLGRAILLAGIGLAAAPALADDLREALITAYNTNPTLQAARAQQRAVDEGVPIAKAPSLPSLTGTANYIEFVKQSQSSFTAPERALQTQANLGMPVYSGGAIKNSIQAAKTRVEAGQQDLRAAESGVFSQVVASYMDVILNEAVVGLNRQNVQRLVVNLQATRDRFEIGDLTRTDVAQSESRLAVARGQTRGAEANLLAARERYIQIVGKAPGKLDSPPPLAGLPADPDSAVGYALDHNPDLGAARERAKAARFDSKAAGSSRLPSVSLFATGNYTNYYGTLGGPISATLPQTDTTAQVGVRATLPIFQGGLPAAQKRQAQAREGALLEQEIATERAVIANVRAAYAQYQAANEIIDANKAAVSAAELSLEGVRAENTVGNRTILDILNAEQELLSAQVQLATAERNGYVAGFNLLAAMGKAEARDLALDGGALYDPQTNYDQVKGSIFDWATNPAPKAKATRTVDTKAQDGTVTPN